MNYPGTTHAPSLGVMFHHFFDGQRHPMIEGALSIDEFDTILSSSGRFIFLPAAEWLDRLESGKLRETELCITFDDALLSQYELAEPVLRRHGLTAFWFVYSSVFNGEIPLLEVYRYFRNVIFAKMSTFYDEYFLIANKIMGFGIEKVKDSKKAQAYLEEFSIYNEYDRIFRYMRDRVLTAEQNDKIMNRLMAEYGFDPMSVADKLWLKNEHIQELSKDDHVVGLHSYSHPTNLSLYNSFDQKNEYVKNAKHLSDIIGYVPKVMAHPSNSYNDETLKILNELCVKYGFRSNNSIKRPNNLELPRIDHTLFAT